MNRRDAYQHLSACYYLPEEDTVIKLPELEEAMGSEYPEAAKHVSNMSVETELEQLVIDYSMLFLGPFKLLAPPYGSIYLESGRRIMGDSTLDAHSRYREAGLAISGDFKEVPDHIAIELEFMYYLVLKEIESIVNSDFENAIEYLKEQKSFLENHLGVWVPELTAGMVKHSKTEFYRELARSTLVFIENDLHVLSETSIAELISLAEQVYIV
jgi:TorA maturation chaperone TorD